MFNVQDDEDRGAGYSSSKQDILRTVAFFPETFQLPSGVTSLIKAFWLLDHKEFAVSSNAILLLSFFVRLCATVYHHVMALDA